MMLGLASLVKVINEQISYGRAVYNLQSWQCSKSGGCGGRLNFSKTGDCPP
jgi:hypothetical protein